MFVQTLGLVMNAVRHRENTLTAYIRIHILNTHTQSNILVPRTMHVNSLTLKFIYREGDGRRRERGQN